MLDNLLVSFSWKKLEAVQYYIHRIQFLVGNNEGNMGLMEVGES